MPQRKGETQEAYMDRIRASRGLPPMREDPQIMRRTRAAVAFINGTNASEAAKMAAFLDIFHPEVQGQQHLSLMQAARAQDRCR